MIKNNNFVLWTSSGWWGTIGLRLGWNICDPSTPHASCGIFVNMLGVHGPCCFMNSLLVDLEPMVRSPVVWHWFPVKLAEPRVGAYPTRWPSQTLHRRLSPRVPQLNRLRSSSSSKYIAISVAHAFVPAAIETLSMRKIREQLFISENIESANVIAFQDSFVNDEFDDWMWTLVV